MSQRFLFILLGATVFLAGCVSQSRVVPESSALVACTEEAKICPDGTAVGRTGPNCEFEACPEIVKKSLDWKVFSTDMVEGLAGPFTFSATIPAGWQVEAVPAIEAINIFDPKAEGENNLEKSQIFVRYFRANTFLTLNTVTIFEQSETGINGRTATTYDIEKKPGIPNFARQPLWRSGRHLVTDIREQDVNPSVFYVFGRHPDLSQEDFATFANSLTITRSQKSEFIHPVLEFYDRITKKPFGIYITPQNSPVQPERFTGYHTAVDVEYEDVADEVGVFAIADGVVKQAQWVAGYGGMIAIQHQAAGQPIIAIYGHLDPASLVANESEVTIGQQIGELGTGGTRETDGARKHLHFGIYPGTELNIKGYVPDQAQLDDWVDSVEFLK